MFKEYHDKQLFRAYQTGKNPTNFEKGEIVEFEQKPELNFDSFSDKEQQEIKKKAEKKLFEMWDRLNELNGQFKKKK